VTLTMRDIAIVIAACAAYALVILPLYLRSKGV
jgi:hypothetical protein